MYSILWCTYLVIRLRGITETEVCGQPDNIVRVVVDGRCMDLDINETLNTEQTASW